MRRRELPASLGEVFTVRQAADAGVGRSRLRASDLVVPHRGLRTRSGLAPLVLPDDREYERRRRQVLHRAHVYAHVMPTNQFFTHVVAACAWKLPIPLSLLDDDRALDVGVLAPARHARRASIRGHQMQAHLVREVQTEGLRVTDPASTWATMASVLVSDIELIALGDAVVRERIFRGDREPLASIADLAESVEAGRRVGVRRLRDALPRVRTRSASSGETRCRLTITAAALPEPQLNVAVLDRSGALVAVVDLAYPAWMIAIEYEGEQHRLDAEQWARDITRHEALDAMGWIVIRITKQQLYGAPQGVVARIRRAIASRA